MGIDTKIYLIWSKIPRHYFDDRIAGRFLKKSFEDDAKKEFLRHDRCYWWKNEYTWTHSPTHFVETLPENKKNAYEEIEMTNSGYKVLCDLNNGNFTCDTLSFYTRWKADVVETSPELYACGSRKWSVERGMFKLKTENDARRRVWNEYSTKHNTDKNDSMSRE